MLGMSYRGTKIEAKLSEFRSEPFRGRVNNSEFFSLEQKKVNFPEFLRRNPDPVVNRLPGSSVPYNKTRQPQI
jgi:hypothetical protein